MGFSIERFKDRLRRRLPRVTDAIRRFRYRSERRRLRSLSTKDIFAGIYRNNCWGNDESVSGEGSTLAQTRAIRRYLPTMLGKFGVRSLLDIPCGDFHWMNEVKLDLERYIGGDIVAEVIQENVKRYAREDKGRVFVTMDLLQDQLPQTDLILCRDCLVHLSFNDISSAISNIKTSGSKYLFTTTYPERAWNADIASGQWRPINFEIPPFSFPQPLQILDEESTEGGGGFTDKSMGLWRISDIHSCQPI